MTFTDFDDTLFEAGDILTEANIVTYIGDNLMALAHPLANEFADRDLVSTTSEFSLWSTVAGGVTVAADLMGANGSLLMVIAGDFLYNNNTADTMTIRCKFGGSTQVGSTFTPSGSTSATRKPFILYFWVRNRAATNAQLNMAQLCGGSIGTGSTVAGIGALGRNPGTDTLAGVMHNTSAIDTTADQTLDVTAQWSASSANNSWRKHWAQVLLAEN